MIYLIRHGETDLNKKSYAGREDIALNVNGLAQADMLVRRFGTIRPAVIYSSPLKRAMQTAEPLRKKYSSPLIVDSRLLELDFGCLQGQAKNGFRLIVRKDYLYKPIPGGESLQALYERVGEFTDEVLRGVREDENVLVMAHYWVNRLLYGYLCGLSLEKAVRSKIYRPENGSVLEVDIERDH